ncbi:MAG: zinc-binding dehydrogenase [Alphaproteobacteria bacterium]|jgi:threonine dehydrogenase-like Zn-dependent dehydrogenase|nr:zinc-binding dehydrogenase [Alphaproteobacteria bacterium]MDP6517969.1 zinc-binding dehydrogenase [Alphaproteobacteria bacterium]
MEGKIAYMDGPGELSFREYPVPDDIEPGAVLLEVIQSNVCGSEIHIFGGHHPAIKTGGLGHEMVGRILECGPGVTTDHAGQPVGPGDRVAPVYLVTCGHCQACGNGRAIHCDNKFKYWGNQDVAPHFHGATFATHYYIHPDQQFFKVPDAVPDGPAASANCALSQVLYGLDTIGVGAGDKVVIQGAGGLGLNSTAVAKDKGADVAIIDSVPARLDLAREFGADHVIDLNQYPTPETRIERVTELFDGVGADVAVEVTGVPDAVNEGPQMVRIGGAYAVIGTILPGMKTSFDPGVLVRRAVTMRGFNHYPPHYLHKALRMLARTQDRFPFDKLLDRSFPLDQAKAAITHSSERKVVRATIVM